MSVKTQDSRFELLRTMVKSDQVLNFAVSFQGLSKSERKTLAKESPVPFHADLRPKKVDRFIKKYFKHKGISFNPSMDR
jgi:hypothetical protein